VTAPDLQPDPRAPADSSVKENFNPLSDIGPFAGSLEGFDHGKLLDPSHRTPKYQIGRVLARHDFRAGITPELLADLNALGIGEFSAVGRDSVSIANPDAAFEGFTDIDLIRGAASGGEAWQYGIDSGGEIDPGALARGQNSQTASDPFTQFSNFQPGQPGSFLGTFGGSTPGGQSISDRFGGRNPFLQQLMDALGREGSGQTPTGER